MPCYLNDIEFAQAFSESIPSSSSQRTMVIHSELLHFALKILRLFFTDIGA